ncbi:hypothetical protein [Burkholderia cenocepacia]|uniref:hypothetical protein n=1 Tax=Burkholderia cenocepacia TaxID=95486 RepID=UPI001CF58B31|nr:hypothetical protein [Burkholderia cenocepacia]MCA8235558.1 hypothetical protein [Burkholderia cenocepacia]
MTEKEQADCPYFLHSSIQLYAMVQHSSTTRPYAPDAIDSADSGNMQMICTIDPFICTYLSPVDAVIGSRTLARDDGHFWPIDFRQVDTRHFIEQHGRLLIAVNYAYAATGGRLVVSDAGYPLMTYTSASFDVPVGHRTTSPSASPTAWPIELKPPIHAPDYPSSARRSTRWIHGPPSK